MSRRVVVTGMGGVSPLGDSWSVVREHLQAGRTAVRRMPEWDAIDGLKTRLGAPIVDFVPPAHFTRKKTRTMGRVALLATYASELALTDAGLLDSQELDLLQPLLRYLRVYFVSRQFFVVEYLSPGSWT